MPKVAVIAKLTAQDGKRDDLAQAFEQGIENAQGEEGTLFYILNADVKDANVLWLYELYTDEEAVKAHSTSDAFKALGPVMAPFMAGRPELIMLNPLKGKGLPS
jgi:quinol monooxygenase YgiN